MAQAGRRWQRSLFPWLLEHGFTQSKHDPCIFHLHRQNVTPKGKRDERLVVGVYVDDLCCAYSHGDKHSIYQDFVTKLHEWKVEDEGELRDLLNVEFSRDNNHVLLQQVGYIDSMVSRFLPDGIPPDHQSNRTPCDPDIAQHVADALASIDPPEAQLLKNYQSLVGALLYCSTHTRPDVAYSVGMLCRAMARPNPALFQAALRVLGYLYRTREIGLLSLSRHRAALRELVACATTCRRSHVGHANAATSASTRELSCDGRSGRATPTTW